MTPKSIKILFQVIIVLSFQLAFTQDTEFTCKNDAYTYLKNTIGTWKVSTTDRTSPGNYEKNDGISTITNLIDNCGIKESFRGTYLNKPYAREVFITGIDSVNVQMIALDSEHGSFSNLEGQVKNDTLTTYWFRNKKVKKLQSKYVLVFNDKNNFEFSSFLSKDYGKNWALTHKRIYRKNEND